MSTDLIVLNISDLSMKSSFETAKAALEKLLEDDKGLVVTEDSVASCKKRTTYLNNLAKQINTKKIEVKNEASVDIVKFEEGCKELIAMVDKVNDSIKQGLLVFEDKRREGKKKAVETYISFLVSEYQLTQKYAAMLVVDEKYMNISTKAKEIESDLTAKAVNLKQLQDESIRLKEAVLQHIESMRAMFDLAQAFTYADFKYLLDADPIDMGYTMSEITKKAKARKDVELKAVERQKEIEAETEKKSLEDEARKAFSVDAAATVPSVSMFADPRPAPAFVPVAPTFTQPTPMFKQPVTMDVPTATQIINNVAAEYTLAINVTPEQLSLLKSFLFDKKIFVKTLVRNR